MLSFATRGELQRLGLLSPEWPDWAVDTFVSLSLACMLLVAVQWVYDLRSLSSSAGEAGDEEGKARLSGSAVAAARFRRFQYKYLVVYLTVMLADWLQGTNMYTLYQSYEVDVGTLFLTGFSSAAIFGTFLGLFVDRFGRRNGCIVFCLLEIIINALEHIPDMRLLLLGRVLGGISTSLLFSAFESWMVSEHRKQGFPEEWLTGTFSAATVGNGIMAVLAGVVAQVASDKLGDIGPFQVAIALTVLALSLLLLWEENYGYGEEQQQKQHQQKQQQQQQQQEQQCISNGHGSNFQENSHNDDSGNVTKTPPATEIGATATTASARGNGERAATADGNGNGNGNVGVCSGIGKGGGGGAAPGLRESVSLAWGCIMSDQRVMLLGLVQSLFEGGTFTFVFMWVPTLHGVVPNGVLPTGLVFSSFMVCITIGGVLFSVMLRKMTVELAAAAVFFVAAASMALPAATRDFPTVLIAFLVLETCVGAFYSCSGLMRSRYLPGGLQSSVMNIFRLPLNVLVVVGTRMTDIAEPETVFMVIASWFLASALLQLRLNAFARDDGDEKKIVAANKKMD